MKPALGVGVLLAWLVWPGETIGILILLAATLVLLPTGGTK